MVHDVEAVVVDVLGTLVDEPGGLRAAFREAVPTIDDETSAAMLARWQEVVERAQREIADGARPYADSREVDREAAHRAAELAGLTDPVAIERLAAAGQRLEPWADAVDGLRRLAERFPVLGLSNASRAALLRLDARAGLRWHLALSAEDARAYKPAPEVYRLALDAAACPADRVLMVAAHAWDLRGAQAVGMRTAYVHRPVGDPPTAADRFDGQFDSLDGLIVALGAA